MEILPLFSTTSSRTTLYVPRESCLRPYTTGKVLTVNFFLVETIRGLYASTGIHRDRSGTKDCLVRLYEFHDTLTLSVFLRRTPTGHTVVVLRWHLVLEFLLTYKKSVLLFYIHSSSFRPPLFTTLLHHVTCYYVRKEGHRTVPFLEVLLVCPTHFWVSSSYRIEQSLSCPTPLTGLATKVFVPCTWTLLRPTMVLRGGREEVNVKGRWP